MKSSRSIRPCVAGEAGFAEAGLTEAGSSNTPVRAWVRFWFTAADPIGLHVLRLLAGLLFFAWLAPMAGHRDNLFGLDGWFDQRAYAEAARLPGGPPKPFTWSVLYLIGGDARLLTAASAAALAVLALFTLGLYPRLTALLTWVVVASFTANPVLDADVDALLIILAFYLAAGYLLMGQQAAGQSLTARLLGPRAVWPLDLLWKTPPAEPIVSVAANVAVRLLQVHFAVVVVTSGLHKLQYGDWWAGVALWYPLYPPLETTLAEARQHAAQGESYLFALSLVAYAMLAWQIGFPLFAWRPAGRAVLLGGALVGWLGTAFVYRMPLFGPAYAIGCLSFLTPAEWRGLGLRLARLAGLRRMGPEAPREVMHDGTAVLTGEHRS